MKQLFIKFIKHPLIKGSTIILAGTLAANVFNFLFNLYVVRSVSNADYGIYASMMSIIGFPLLLASAITPLVVQFAGRYFAKEQHDMVRGFYKKIMKFYSLLSVSIFLVFLLCIPQISAFLHIKDTLILVVTDLIILLSMLGIVNSAFIQAKLSFGFQVFVTFINAFSKFVLGIILITMGYAVTGAAFATLLGSLAAYIVGFIPIRFVFDRKTVSPKIQTKEIFIFGVPSSLTMIGLTSFISADILLVKHFFDPVNAGIYAALALVGKIIFYLSSPISAVLFPVLVQKHSRHEKLTNTLLLALLMVVSPSLLLTIVYFIFPEQTLLFFTKKTENTIVSPLLGLFGIFMTMYCLLFILANFYLSIKKTVICIPILIGAIVQIVLISLFHQTFLQIVLISMTITFLLMCIFLIYFPFAIKK